MKAVKTKIEIIIAIVGIVIVWILLALVDALLVFNQKKPVFSLKSQSYSYQLDNYNEYKGLGYTFVVMDKTATNEQFVLYEWFGAEVYNSMKGVKSSNEELPPELRVQ